jgi:pyruvate carboxylase
MKMHATACCIAQIVNGPSHPGAKGSLPPKLPTVLPPSVPEGATKPPTGWRDLLVTEGPEAWARAVRNHKGVLITDTTWWAPFSLRPGFSLLSKCISPPAA